MPAIKPTMVPIVVDSATTLVRRLDSTADLLIDPPPLYFDLKGVELSRLGSTSLASLYIAP